MNRHASSVQQEVGCNHSKGDTGSFDGLPSYYVNALFRHQVVEINRRYADIGFDRQTASTQSDYSLSKPTGMSQGAQAAFPGAPVEPLAAGQGAASSAIFLLSDGDVH